MNLLSAVRRAQVHKELKHFFVKVLDILESPPWFIVLIQTLAFFKFELDLISLKAQVRASTSKISEFSHLFTSFVLPSDSVTYSMK
jgi:hypothetical protein